MDPSRAFKKTISIAFLRVLACNICHHQSVCVFIYIFKNINSNIRHKHKFVISSLSTTAGISACYLASSEMSNVYYQAGSMVSGEISKDYVC